MKKIKQFFKILYAFIYILIVRGILNNVNSIGTYVFGIMGVYHTWKDQCMVGIIECIIAFIFIIMNSLDKIWGKLNNIESILKEENED